MLDMPIAMELASFSPLTTHAVVLAGGAGSRITPLPSSSIPKALLPIANRPMIFYALFSIHRAHIPSASVFVSAEFRNQIETYVNEIYVKDPLVKALQWSLTCEFLVRDEEGGTADALRILDGADAHATTLVVLSSDYVGNISIERVLQHHIDTLATATVTLVRQKCTPVQVPKQKGKASKKPAQSSTYSVTNYAMLSDEHRLLALISPSDLTNNKVIVRPTLTRRYDSIKLCSDMYDPHVYVFHKMTVRYVLRLFPAISSVRFDLVPYLARRQHTLQRTAETLDWPYPGEQLVVNALVLDATSTYAKRANTVEHFLATNAEVASGCINTFLSPSDDPPERPKKGKKSERKLPFVTAGEKVSVSPDSAVAHNVTAGHRTSVKKSVVGPNCKLGSNVKINGCVLMQGVVLEDGVNLSSCVVCDDAVIGHNSTLKDCRVAAGIVVSPESEVSDKDFTGAQEDVYGLGDIEFV
ncbi:Translation initiation factor eIF-2B subunit gamma [Gracilariopsis chorda]|uniref:Translation initiation factor eIF2B subunit gamma n=1 Tax=Gracilariopsis chorda TaxID=448386 RepID=A0A2V3ISA9_9FLOR|nr:Translation initiation factor eIF-2B subunit gamma [Gracilariopsis chorda]|eukprot:PXF45018.1 Translation initiation factor eIF-2B subunit gamma [Gracilariopsis chorda]